MSRRRVLCMSAITLCVLCVWACSIYLQTNSSTRRGRNARKVRDSPRRDRQDNHEQEEPNHISFLDVTKSKGKTLSAGLYHQVPSSELIDKSIETPHAAVGSVPANQLPSSRPRQRFPPKLPAHKSSSHQHANTAPAAKSMLADLDLSFRTSEPHILLDQHRNKVQGIGEVSALTAAQHPMPARDAHSHTLPKKSNLDASQSFGVRRVRDENVPVGEKILKILMWTPYFNEREFYVGVGREFFVKNCIEDRCEAVRKRTHLAESAAIVFHLRDLPVQYTEELMPDVRSSKQRWVLHNMESPANTFHDLPSYESVFNWTFSYQREANLYVPYRSFVAHNRLTAGRNWDADVQEMLNGKKATAFLMASNGCRNAPSGRDRYVHLLEQDLRIEKLGLCFDKGCPRDENARCDYGRSYLSSFRFYLAFENSRCRDYVTERLYDFGFRLGALPVVLGAKREDYEALLPPNSFVFADDFPAPRQLAQYLNYLEKNETAYAEYFQWWRTYRHDYFVLFEQAGFCKLCAMLHDHTLPANSVNDFENRWMRRDNCWKPTF